MKDIVRNHFINLLKEQINQYYISKNDKRGLHKIKYSTKYILNIIIDKINLGVSWRDIKYLKSNTMNTNHSVIFYMYEKMIKNDIIKKAYNNLLNKYCIKIDNSCAYIDSTYIINKYGYNSYVKYNNYAITKHKTCKLSIISSKNGFPLGVSIANSLEHDINLVLNTIPKNPLFKKLYGDKGYISNKIQKEIKQKTNIELIAPPRKNQINKLSTDDKNALKYRYVIEHLNNFIKQNKQIQTRFIKSNKNFLEYIYLIFIKRILELIY